MNEPAVTPNLGPAAGTSSSWGDDALGNSIDSAQGGSSATPVQTLEQAGQERVPIIFKDGTHDMVPRSSVLDIVKSGDGEVGHYMRFPDGSHDYIPHDNYQGAVADGGKDADPATLREQAAVERAKNPTAGDYASIAGTTALNMIPVMRGSAKAATTAGEAVAPSLSALFKTIAGTAKDADVAAGTIEGEGAQKVIALAKAGIQAAEEAGSSAKKIGYTMALRGAQAYKTYSNISTWLDKTVPGLPLALKVAAMAEFAHSEYRAHFADKKEEARQELYGDK